MFLLLKHACYMRSISPKFIIPCSNLDRAKSLGQHGLAKRKASHDDHGKKKLLGHGRWTIYIDLCRNNWKPHNSLIYAKARPGYKLLCGSEGRSYMDRYYNISLHRYLLEYVSVLSSIFVSLLVSLSLGVVRKLWRCLSDWCSYHIRMYSCQVPV
jgi:hypothetical protein